MTGSETVDRQGRVCTIQVPHYERAEMEEKQPKSDTSCKRRRHYFVLTLCFSLCLHSVFRHGERKALLGGEREELGNSGTALSFFSEKYITGTMSTFTQQPSPDPEEALKKELLMLEAQRDALELEADAIASELKSPGANGEPPVGVKGPLVDSDGYPLAGVDLFNVRAKRHRLNCIQTDHKAVMAKLEKSLHALHEARSARPTPSPSSSPAPAVAPSTAAGDSLVPIAKVNEVSDGSPAATAGLEVGDLVLRFGGVDISHPKGLGGVVDVVREKEGQEVPVRVLRGGERDGVKDLTLVPKTWSGRGLLGVHLLPP